MLFGFFLVASSNAKNYTLIESNQTLTGIATDNYEFAGGNATLYLSGSDSLIFNDPYDLRITSNGIAGANLSIFDGATLEINSSGGPEVDWTNRGSGLFIYNSYATVSGGTLNVTMSNATAGTGIEFRTDNATTTFTINNGASVNVDNAGGTGFRQEGNTSLNISNAVFTSNSHGGQEGIYIKSGNLTVNDGARIESTNTSGNGIRMEDGQFILSNATITSDNQGGLVGFHAKDSSVTINAAAILSSTSSGSLGIYVEGGDFTVNEGAVISSASTGGNGIFFDRANALFSNATFNSNHSGGEHGMYIGYASTVTLSAGAVIDSTNTSGNGIYIGGWNGGQLILSNATIRSNNDGGIAGIYSAPDNTNANITASDGARIESTNTSGNGIWNVGIFLLSNATLTSNSTVGGEHGINNAGGSFTANAGAVINSTNTAGNGIYNSGQFLLSNATLTSNSQGGIHSIYNNGGNFTVNESAVINSTNTVGNGVYNSGQLVLSNATLTSNSQGGEHSIYGSRGNFTVNESALINSTNTAGNGIRIEDGRLLLSNATITSDNQGGDRGFHLKDSSITINAAATLNSTSSGSLGIYVEGGDFTVNEGAVINSISSAGIGIYFDRVNAVLSNTSINSNHSGGAHGMYIGYASTVTLSAGAVIDSTNTSGNGIFVGGWNGGQLILSNATILSSNDGGIAGINNDPANEGADIVANTGARIESINTSGSGIRNAGNFLLTNATLTSNSTAGGEHGINNAGGSFTANAGAVINSTNTAGSGIYNTGQFVLSNAILTSNNHGAGYGIYNDGGSLTVNQGALINSTNTSGNGIRIENGSLLLSNATVSSDNQGGDRGFQSKDSTVTLNAGATINSTSSGSFGLYIEGGSFTINEGATINSSNTAGNGIYFDRANAFLSNAIITSNHSGGEYGIFVGYSSTVTVNEGTLLSSSNSVGNGIYNSPSSTFIVSGSGTLLDAILTGSSGNAIHNGAIFSVLDGATLNATASAGGNAILNSGSTAVFRIDANSQVNISGNFVNANGAQLINNSVLVMDSGNLILDNTRYEANTSSGNGILFLGADSGLVVRNGATFVSEVSSGNGIYAPGNITVTGDGTSFTQTVDGTTANGIHNAASANILVSDSASFNQTVTNGTGIHNSGSITVDGATLMSKGSTTSNAILNTGTIEILNGALVSAANTTIYNSGNITVGAGSTFELGTNGQLVVDGNLSSEGTLLFSGTNQLVAGSGTIDASLNNMVATTRLSPGNYDTAGAESSVGTLGIRGSQSWQNGFIYDWQLGKLDATAAGDGNDLINISGALGLSASGSYTLNVSTLLSGMQTLEDVYTWTLISTSDGVNGFDAKAWTLSLDNGLAAIGLNKYYYLRVSEAGNDLLLIYLSNLDFYWGANAGSGTWRTGAKWDKGLMPDMAGAHAYFEYGQGGRTEVDMEGNSYTIGNLTIGANATADSSTVFGLVNGELNLDNKGTSSVVTHSATANDGDVINVTLNASNDVQFDVKSAGNSSLDRLAIGFTPSGDTEWGRWNGTITNSTLSGTGTNRVLTVSEDINLNTHDLVKSGSGTLLVTADILGAQQIRHTGGALFLDGNVAVSNGLTVSSGAILGGGGTINGNINFAQGAIFRQGRDGAQYNVRLNLTGSGSNLGGMSFDLTAALGRAFSDNAGDRMSASYSSGLDIGGLFSFDVTAEYTVNIYNLTDFHIVDWSIQKNANDGVYYSLLSWTGGSYTQDDFANWKLNFLGANRPDDPGAWDLILKEHNGKHVLWLYYANPVRIPEPGTYAVIVGALILGFTIIRKRRK